MCQSQPEVLWLQSAAQYRTVTCGLHRETNWVGIHTLLRKLVLLSTLDGIPVAYELVPANSDERLAAETVLSTIQNCDVFGDKGFLGEDWQQEQFEFLGNRIWTPKRANQLIQNPVDFDRWLNSLRERIEGAFPVQSTGLCNEVQNITMQSARHDPVHSPSHHDAVCT